MGKRSLRDAETLSREAHDRFLPVFGRAMYNWSYIENALCEWFALLSGMNRRTARAVFFSARSFNGRADMLAALIAGAPTLTPPLEFARMALDKSRIYAQVRNSLAHRIGQVRTPPDADWEVELHEGKRILDTGDGAGIGRQELEIIAENFRGLGTVIRRAWVYEMLPASRRVPLQELVEQLTQLPNQPDSTEPSQKQRGRARQRKSSRK